MSNDRYQLIDFGEGRKLESLAGHIVDRPCPAALHASRQRPRQWRQADARYDAAAKQWVHHSAWPEHLDLNCGCFRMPARPTPYGHIGVFPEQFDNWQWLASLPQGVNEDPESVKGLNLFGYTGASTLALIGAGFQVAHVDAAKPNVQAARANAWHNGWADAPLRYLVDDAAKFAAREVRRGRRYHTVVLDPPAYGHAPRGKAWRLERDLWPLLENCLRLLDPQSFRLLVTGHSPEIDQADVVDFLNRQPFRKQITDMSGLLLQSGRSQLKDLNGRSLDTGFYVRLENKTPLKKA